MARLGEQSQPGSRGVPLSCGEAVGTVPGWHSGALLAPSSRPCPSVTPPVVPVPLRPARCSGLEMLLVFGTVGSSLVLALRLLLPSLEVSSHAEDGQKERRAGLELDSKNHFFFY